MKKNQVDLVWIQKCWRLKHVQQFQRQTTINFSEQRLIQQISFVLGRIASSTIYRQFVSSFAHITRLTRCALASLSRTFNLVRPRSNRIKFTFFERRHVKTNFPPSKFIRREEPNSHFHTQKTHKNQFARTLYKIDCNFYCFVSIIF